MGLTYQAQTVTLNYERLFGVTMSNGNSFNNGAAYPEPWWFRLMRPVPMPDR